VRSQVVTLMICNKNKSFWQLTLVALIDIIEFVTLSHNNVISIVRVHGIESVVEFVTLSYDNMIEFVTLSHDKMIHNES